MAVEKEGKEGKAAREAADLAAANEGVVREEEVEEEMSSNQTHHCKLAMSMRLLWVHSSDHTIQQSDNTSNACMSTADHMHECILLLSKCCLERRRRYPQQISCTPTQMCIEWGVDVLSSNQQWPMLRSPPFAFVQLWVR